jgi:DNA polymerase III alpha subunit
VRWVEDGKTYRRSLGLLPPEGTPEWRVYEERLAYELEIIQYHSFENYFLVVTDIVRWCQKKKYWCIARGSCGGSLACWYLGITQIDPLFFKLPVERFIDKTRKDMPDIDLDIDARYRDLVFGYLEEKYGKSHTAQIAALSTFRPKQAIRDVCDIYEIPQSVGALLVGLLPEIDNEGGIKAKGLLDQLLRWLHSIRSSPSPPTWKVRSGTRQSTRPASSWTATICRRSSGLSPGLRTARGRSSLAWWPAT